MCAEVGSPDAEPMNSVSGGEGSSDRGARSVSHRLRLV